MIDQDPDDHEISLHPAPGTCCPDMRILNGQCKGCDRVVVPVCQRRTDRACLASNDDAEKGCLGRLDCEGYKEEWRVGVPGREP